jgi:hypothetical protein
LIRGGRGKTQSVIAVSKRLMGEPATAMARHPVASPPEKAEIAGK